GRGGAGGGGARLARGRPDPVGGARLGERRSARRVARARGRWPRPRLRPILDVEPGRRDGEAGAARHHADERVGNPVPGPQPDGAGAGPQPPLPPPPERPAAPRLRHREPGPRPWHRALGGASVIRIRRLAGPGRRRPRLGTPLLAQSRARPALRFRYRWAPRLRAARPGSWHTPARRSGLG